MKPLVKPMTTATRKTSSELLAFQDGWLVMEWAVEGCHAFGRSELGGPFNSVFALSNGQSGQRIGELSSLVA